MSNIKLNTCIFMLPLSKPTCILRVVAVSNQNPLMFFFNKDVYFYGI